jgi:23S rRNA (cytidine1920-2'-O)/16S rRNA (cytidine1409-2'-O)-methyltransferase
LTRRLRLDAELLRRGLVSSRTEAQEAVARGSVLVGGIPARRTAALVDAGTSIKLASAPSRFVSRGGDKLDGALERLRVPVSERSWLDAGAATGGFTDRLLQGGARHVAAVDVGYGQLSLKIRDDRRVTVVERTNVRYLEVDHLPFRPEAVVADLSFISLRLVLPALASVARPEADHVLLVKPQFEVGKELVGAGGVVRDPHLWLTALVGVAQAASEEGLGVAGAVASHLPGAAGNREFFIHLRRGRGLDQSVLGRAVEEISI